MLGRSRRGKRGERGAVALEAALTFPILLLILLGIIELTFLMRDHAVVVSDTRLAARIASTGANAGQGVCETGPDAPPCVPSNVPALAQKAADAIQRAGSAMPVDQIQYLLVYKANAQGYPGSDGNTTMPTSCSGYASCVKFVWRPNQNAFRYNSGSWDPRTISACFPGTGSNALDRVGIQLVASHKTFTGLFGSSLNLEDHAVMNFEPLPTQFCASGAHS
ncbi:MAG TPA: TadE/TadG family type IV pilus assembly protein [Nocardioides sp.]|uniref:TadE/TadG family type IV pilus assembly protein n=1 Tax=Nocardioides sp. TaxID=35761 RepID=UPI002E36F00E|nr:TadE/TadG family type IV pilus assembly protein [Nocardioides sp.]HEX5090499.1 TadE/TadG family type IV pilus assembly protein [Nocardioides sp.]